MTKWRNPLKSIPQADFPMSADELSKRLAPLYQQYEEEIRSCISGIIKHACCLAATNQESHLSELKELVVQMAEFWSSEHEEQGGYLRIRERIEARYDQAITRARETGNAPELSAQEKDNVLSGLQIHRCEMQYTGGMGDFVRRCGRIEDELRRLWLEGPSMAGLGGMTL